MFVDARSLDEGTKIESDVCIIGAGVAGITLALELDRQGIPTCLLESGGFGPDDKTDDLNRGESADLPYSFADGCRSRFLGGSSNCWGGWCRPFDAVDFERRGWVRYSGWPITRADLEPHYKRTHDILKLGPYNYDPEYWERAITRTDVKRIPLPSGRVVDTISQFSPPVRMGKVYYKALSRSTNVRVVLYANVTQIESTADAGSVRALRIATLSGRKHVATARQFVLATGGIENARLLLVSNTVHRAGLGNGHDLVGRFFMDHPRIYCGSITFAPAWARNKLFDAQYHSQNNAVSANGTRVAAQLSLTPAVQAEHRLSNARVWFSSVFYGDGTEGAETLSRLKRRLALTERPGSALARDLLTLAAHPIHATGFAMSRFVQAHWLVRDVRFQAIVEPEPDPDARVTLSMDRDRLGVNRVRVGWRLGPLVRRTFDRNFAIVADELQRAGVAKVVLDEPLEGRTDWPASLDGQGTWHHTGTTRMHDSPHDGVVDRNCRVHGISNLYITGSSVFPTAGANFPTITICALALRLAEHLTSVTRAGGSNPAGRAS
jgi:choline dehydrogenase-like flavoprotein